MELGHPPQPPTFCQIEAARSTSSQPHGPFNLKLPCPSTARHETSQSPRVCHSGFLEGSLAPHIPGHCVVCKSRVYFKRKEKRWLASTVESGTREHSTRAAAGTDKDRQMTVLASPFLPPRRKQPASSNVPSTIATNEHKDKSS